MQILLKLKRYRKEVGTVMKCYKKIIIALLLIMLIILYILMICDTNSVIKDFKHCISGENISQQLKNTELYNKYFSYLDVKASDIDIDVKRLFVFHNFNSGVMYVKYSYELLDNYNNCLRGAKDVNSKWYIKKENRIWEVVKIEEKP